ncbi:MAG: DUF3857 domain-containing protein [Bacteroidetes bacterium]|nr:DUF3857 domain-containing protein [Bacteroidota bacterium]
MRNAILTITLLLSVVHIVNAQSKDAEKYRKESEQMRQTVWAWDKPQFKVRDIPQQYANASKVIIAHHTELTADSKSKFAFYGLGFGPKKELTLTEVTREMVKVNDKSAVTDFSEFSFTQFERTSGFFSTDKTTSYVGVRVIKPNGTIKEINADDVILTKDEAAEKKAKIAVPDLQPGDIIDYFIATEQNLTNDISNKPYRVLLFDDAPILSLSFHGQLGKKYAIQYRSYNGAPELQVNKNEDKDIIIDLEKTNIPPFETALWVAPGLQLPFIRMNISLGYKGMGSKWMDTQKPGEVSKNTDSDEFIDDKASSLSVDYYNNYWMKAAKDQFDAIESDAKKRAKNAGIAYKDLSDEDKAAQLYYTFRFTKLLNFDINALKAKIDIGNARFNGFAFLLFCTFKASGLKPAILVSPERDGLRMAEIMSAGDLTTAAYLPESKKFFTIRSVYDIPFSIPDNIEGLTGTKSFTFDHPAMIMGMKKMMGLTNIDPGPDVPTTTSDKNAHIENLQLSLTADKNNLTVRRSTTLRGFYKVEEQRELVLYEDLYEAERKAFNEDKSLLDDLEDSKKGKKYVDEVRSAFAEARKKQKDAFVKEAKDWFEQDVTELKEYKTDNLGIRHTAPDFVYSSSFNLSGLVKKAGNNLIVEIGKIQGTPLVIKQEQRKRDIDVYMPYARSIEYNIQLDIPDGYTAEGVTALNKKVENETGYFSAEASATDKTVTIKLKKHYLHNFEPAKNWDKIIAFTDAANDWVSAKLLFKKK